MKLEGKTAAIIGGGAGIGRAIAFALAARGVRVFIGDVSEESGQQAAEHITGLGMPAGSAGCDLADDASVANFADRAFAEMGRVDLLFNHAGVSLGGLLEQVTSEDWNWMLNVNVVGLGRSIAAFLPRMTDQGDGWITNTSSGLGLFHDVSFAAPYIASKAAIIAYSRACAIYTRNRGIGVSVFCPDITMTAFVTGGRLKGIPPELAAGALPVDRLQTAEAAADLLIAGLEDERFLISAVPDTTEKLIAMATAELAPGSDSFDERGLPVPVVQKGTIRLPQQSRDQAVKLFLAFAERSRKHAGCRAYEIAIDATEPELIVIFEAWLDQASVDAHAAAPDTIEFVISLLALGASDVKAARL